MLHFRFLHKIQYVYIIRRRKKKVNKKRTFFKVRFLLFQYPKLFSDGINACFFLVFAHSFIPNYAVNKREQGVVFTDTNVRTGMNLRASLANEDVPCENCLTVAALRAKAFRFAVSTVVGGAGTFFMSE